MRKLSSKFLSVSFPLFLLHSQKCYRCTHATKFPADKAIDSKIIPNFPPFSRQFIHLRPVDLTDSADGFGGPRGTLPRNGGKRRDAAERPGRALADVVTERYGMRRPRGYEPVTHPATNSGHNPATRFEFAFLFRFSKLGISSPLVTSLRLLAICGQPAEFFGEPSQINGFNVHPFTKKINHQFHC